MRSRFKVLVIPRSPLTAALGASASATAATTTVPVTDTPTFACGNGVCEVGPGNVAMPSAAGLNVSGDGVWRRSYGDDFTMTITSGNLLPGLRLSLPSSEWTVTGTPFTQLSNPWNDGYIIHNVSVSPGGDPQRDQSGEHHAEGQPGRVRHDPAHGEHQILMSGAAPGSSCRVVPACPPVTADLLPFPGPAER
jgi:hypothetical protein